MLTEQEIKQALGASRVVSMPVPNPHGPIGWEHLARSLSTFLGDRASKKEHHSLEIPTETWQKLEQLASEATREQARSISASELATAILQHYVAAGE